MAYCVNSKVTWKAKLKVLARIDWHRSNALVWEGRTMVGGRISKATNNVTLTVNYIKQQLGLTLSPEEARVENNFRSAHGN